MFNAIRDRKKIRKNRALAEKLMRESEIRKAYGVDVSDEQMTINVAPSANPVQSLWAVILSVVQTAAVVILAALALVGLIAILLPETRTALLDQWQYTLQNIEELFHA